MTGLLVSLRYERLYFESNLERDRLVVLDGSGMVRRLGVQAGPYHYREHGGWKRHFFDNVWEGHDGRIVFEAIRPETSSRIADLRRILRRLTLDDPRLAEAEIRLVGRQDCPDWLVQRSHAVRCAWRRPDPEADEAMLGCLRRIGETIRASEAIRASGLGPAGLPAIARLSMTGLVEIAGFDRLNFDARVLAAPLH